MRDSTAGPEKEKQRRLTETDVDPSGDVSSENSGQTEDPGAGRLVDNQPAENHEDPPRDPDTGNRDSENAPKLGHEE
ncbi:MAG: hypothetical protein M3P45_08795 [Acidobacteriota bacterium]|nr:hypothetical protein [Acidobacteriota bacterium]